MSGGPLEQRIVDLLEPSVRGLGYELLGVEFTGQGQHSRLRLFIDREGGVNLDDCEQVSRQVSAVLDVEDPIRGHYALEVSSPGLDRPLFRLEHYSRFVGHLVKVRLSHALAGQRNFKGTIVRVDGKAVVIALEDGSEISLAFDNIDKANLIPVFE